MHCEEDRVVWDDTTVDEFNELYPEFGGEVPEGIIRRSFMYANLIVGNDECSVIPCAQRLILFYLLLAHYVESWRRGSLVVGAITSATQDGVSMSAGDNRAANLGPLATTAYGRDYEIMIAKYKQGPIWVNAPLRHPDRYAPRWRRY